MMTGPNESEAFQVQLSVSRFSDNSLVHSFTIQQIFTDLEADTVAQTMNKRKSDEKI